MCWFLPLFFPLTKATHRGHRFHNSLTIMGRSVASYRLMELPQPQHRYVTGIRCSSLITFGILMFFWYCLYILKLSIIFLTSFVCYISREAPEFRLAQGETCPVSSLFVFCIGGLPKRLPLAISQVSPAFIYCFAYPIRTNLQSEECAKSSLVVKEGIQR